MVKTIVATRDSGNLDSVYRPDRISDLPAEEQSAWLRFWFNVSKAERQLTYVDPALVDMSQWTTLDPVKITSEAGASFERQPDASFLVTGPHEERDVYTIQADLDATGITTLRLDVFPDARLPKNGPGRNGSGNFHLSEIVLEIPDETSNTGYKQLPFDHAWATYASHSWPVMNAIDGDPDSGWQIWNHGGAFGVFQFSLMVLRSANVERGKNGVSCS